MAADNNTKKIIVVHISTALNTGCKLKDKANRYQAPAIGTLIKRPVTATDKKRGSRNTVSTIEFATPHINNSSLTKRGYLELLSISFSLVL